MWLPCIWCWQVGSGDKWGNRRGKSLTRTRAPDVRSLGLLEWRLGLEDDGQYLSVPASVSFITLLGIAVTDGTVMVTLINSLRTSM